MVTAEQAAREIVRQMSPTARAAYARDRWAEGVSLMLDRLGAWGHLQEAEVMDAIEAVLAE